jgi:prolyl-tRNA synthetase
MFADQELIGIPHRVVLSERTLDADRLEYQGRTDAESADIAIADAIDFLCARIRQNSYELTRMKASRRV